MDSRRQVKYHVSACYGPRQLNRIKDVTLDMIYCRRQSEIPCSPRVRSHPDVELNQLFTQGNTNDAGGTGDKSVLEAHRGVCNHSVSETGFPGSISSIDASSVIEG